jgi:hypothetical protein
VGHVVGESLGRIPINPYAPRHVINTLHRIPSWLPFPDGASETHNVLPHFSRAASPNSTFPSAVPVKTSHGDVPDAKAGPRAGEEPALFTGWDDIFDEQMHGCGILPLIIMLFRMDPLTTFEIW